MSFLDETRSGSSRIGSGLQEWGQSVFSRSYAQGGFSSYAFSPGGSRPWAETHRGSAEYFNRLEQMSGRAQGFSKERLTRTLAEERKLSAAGKIGTRKFGFGGAAFNTALVTLPAFFQEGGIKEKSQAVVGGAASAVGWTVGGKAGMTVGAAVGSSFTPIGTAIGAAVGYLVGAIGGSLLAEKGTSKVFNFFDNQVAAGRKAKTFNWKEDTSAFNTKQAYTMRQASLQMMNQGLMTARSGLGQEGVMLHQ